MSEWTGGCMCGKVRYRLDREPYDAGWCHCRTCQLSSAAPAMAFACIGRADWAIAKGECAIRTIRTSSFGQRSFCVECGTLLYVQVDHQPDTLDFPIVTLDEPGAIAPGFHIFWASKVAWFDPDDDLPRHDRFRPDTVGLEGTEPPDESSLTGGAEN